MLNLEQQVCSIELANKLKELGVKQESLFYWVCINFEAFSISTEEEFSTINENKLISGGCECCTCDDYIKEKYSAFTVAELGELLPYNCISIKIDRKSYKDKKDFYYCYLKELGISNETQFDYKESDARAKMLIYLIENGYIKND